MLEHLMDKRRILEIYLNVIEWGDGVFGAEAAARHYYGVSAASLSPEEAARLAAMVPRPRYYDRNRDAPRLARKTQVILARMHQVAPPDPAASVDGCAPRNAPFTRNWQVEDGQLRNCFGRIAGVDPASSRSGEASSSSPPKVISQFPR